MKKSQICMMLIVVLLSGCGMTLEERKKCGPDDLCFAQNMFDTMRSKCISLGEREVPREYEDCNWRAGRNQVVRADPESTFIFLHMVAQCTRQHERKRGKRGAHSRLLCRYNWETETAQIKVLKR